jgi:hypothetical protein
VGGNLKRVVFETDVRPRGGGSVRLVRADYEKK